VTKLLIFLTAINILGYLDRYIVHSVEPLLKSDLSLTNEESALLTTAFVWGYFLFSPVFGYLGDRWSKPILMGVGIVVWSVATALTGLAGSFTTFFAIRVFVGFGEASFGTIAPGYLKGVLGDPLKLNKALGFFYAAIPCGAALGYFLGGQISSYFSWQAVFYLAAIPGLLLAPGLFRLKDVRTTQREVPPFIQSLGAVVKVRTLWFAIGGYVLNSFALNGIAPFIVRYGTTLGLGISQVQTAFSLILLVTGTSGALVGSMLANKMASGSDDTVKALLRFVGLSTLCGVPFLGGAFLTPSPVIFLALCFFAQLLLFAGVAPINAVIVERAPRGLETLAQGLTILFLNLVGNIGAAFAVGAAADRLLMTGRGEAEALALSMQLNTCAMLLAGVIWFIGSVLEKQKN
jgi:MFS transporter, Spinster family, sphingosine-1-phosphate transporter